MRAAFLLVVAGLSAPAAAQQVRTVGDALAAIEARRNPPEGTAAPPTPATNPSTWVTIEDYPSWAAERGVSGNVSIVLDVDAGGRVTACEVRESSGIPDLDRLACEKITERAQFRPARDGRGNPVAGQWRNRVVWALPRPAPGQVPEPGELVISMVVEPDGSVSKCVIERAEGEAARATSTTVCDSAGPFEPPLDEQGNPQRRRVRLVTSIEHQPLP